MLIIISLVYIFEHNIFYIWKNENFTLFSSKDVDGIISQNVVYIYQQNNLYYTLNNGIREYYKGQPFAELKCPNYKTEYHRNIADFIKKNVSTL
jgi:hypothetical protein